MHENLYRLAAAIRAELPYLVGSGKRAGRQQAADRVSAVLAECAPRSGEGLLEWASHPPAMVCHITGRIIGYDAGVMGDTTIYDRFAGLAVEMPTDTAALMQQYADAVLAHNPDVALALCWRMQSDRRVRCLLAHGERAMASYVMESIGSKVTDVQVTPPYASFTVAATTLLGWLGAL
jgi:hypothetical protein